MNQKEKMMVARLYMTIKHAPRNKKKETLRRCMCAMLTLSDNLLTAKERNERFDATIAPVEYRPQ